MADAFAAITPYVSELRVLGTYPQAEAVGRPGPADAAVAGGTTSNPSDRSRKKLRLDQFLKFEGLVGTGGEAKMRVQGGEVKVNGEVTTQRGKGLRPGDFVQIDQETRTVGPEFWDNSND